MLHRRKQKPISIRSDRAAARLARLTRDGRSQAEVIEEALERMPLPANGDEADVRRARIEALAEQIAAKPRRFRSMAEFDRDQYDERGLPG